MRCTRGIALIEAVIATLLLAGVVAASMQVAAVSATIQSRNAQRSTARFLATAFAADLNSLPYQSPTGTVNFGRESGETSSSKANYDDVDDFRGWSESPPQDRTGTVMAGMEGYTRTVAVDRVSANNLSATLDSETGVKRITIAVKRGDMTLATLVFIRTAAP